MMMSRYAKIEEVLSIVKCINKAYEDSWFFKKEHAYERATVPFVTQVNNAYIFMYIYIYNYMCMYECLFMYVYM
jgi:hypothetical protein